MNKSAYSLRNLIRKGDSILFMVLAKLTLSLGQAEMVNGWLPAAPDQLTHLFMNPTEAS